MIRLSTFALATLALATTPAMAQSERVPAPLESAEELRAGSSLLVVLAAIAAALIVALALAESDNDDNLPASP